MELRDFHKLHTGETALLVGNGENLRLTPPAWFDYPSFGMNTIHLYEGWKPTYYVTVDQRVMREFGDEILERFEDIPKFIPRPNLNKWQGENFYRFLHRPGPIFKDNKVPNNVRTLDSEGISYRNVMHVAMQLAWYMGFTTMLLIGVHHKPFKGQVHFWGTDHGMPANPPTDDWFQGYVEIVEKMREYDITVLNISEDTYLDADIIPRGDWREYAKNKDA